MKKQKSGAGTAQISKSLRQRKPELLLTAAALMIFALIWGADALAPKPVEIFVPVSTVRIEDTPVGINSEPDDEADEPEPLPPKSTHIATAEAKPVTTTSEPTKPSQTTVPQVITAAQQGKININTAGIEDLQTLPGIGPVKARAIADYRLAHGIFLSADELLNVKGIGPATLEKMKPYLAF